MPEHAKLNGEGWFAWYSAEREQWISKYRVRANRWRMHRLPKQVQKADDAKRYMKVYLREKRKRFKPGGTHANGVVSPDMTLKQLGDMWTSGKLRSLYPSYINDKKTSKSDESRLRIYVYDRLGHVAMKDLATHEGVTLCRRVVEPVESKASRATARHVALVINRLFNLAVYPLQIVEANPLPKGFVPTVKGRKAMTWLYPDEDRRLMRCVRVPLNERLFYGFQAREGSRVGEVLGVQLYELDLEHGWGHLDETKTGYPKDWPLQPGTVEALKRYRDRHMRSKDPQARVFASRDGALLDRYELARKLREYLKVAGVRRPQLFLSDGKRLALRVHDLRASFVTVALATGKTMSWVTDRTGHMTAEMVELYTRRARGHREQNLGDWTPLYEAIPELNDDPEKAIVLAAKDYPESKEDEQSDETDNTEQEDDNDDMDDNAAE